MNKKLLTSLAGLALVLPALAACGSSDAADSGNTIRLGNVGSGGQDLPVYVAYEQGFLKKQGLDVKYTAANSPVLSQAITGGSLDFATLPSGSLLSANAAGTGLVMISSIANTPPTSIYAAADISSPEQLKGTKVAVGSVGTASYTEAQVLLDKYQLSSDNLTLTSVSGSGPGILAALQQKLVVAGAFSPPVADQAEASGFHNLINGPESGVDYVSGGLVVKKSYAEAHPDTVKKVAAAMEEAWQFMRDPANKETVIKLLAKDMGLSESEAADGYPQLFPIWSEQTTAAVSEAGMETAIKYNPDAISKNLEATDQFDNSYLPAAAN